MEEKEKSRAMWVVGSVALTAIGFVIIPPLLNKVSSKAYRKAIHSEEIDVDSMGPEIVKKKESEEEQ